MLQRLTAWILGFLTGCLGSPGVAAQSIELVHEQAEIGRPLMLRWQVRPFDLDPNHLLVDCLEVHLSATGEDALPLPIDDLQLRPLAEQGKAVLEVRSNTPILEPLLSARVTLNCGASLSREFSILVAPGHAGSQPSLSTGQAAKKARDLHPTPGAVQKAAPQPTKRAAQLQLDTPRRIASTPALRDDQVLAIAQAVAALLLHQSATPANAPDAGLASDRSAWDGELRQLRQDQQQARAQMASLQLRLERQQDQLPTQWTSALLGAAGLLAAAALSRLWRERRLPRWNSAAANPARPGAPKPGSGTAVAPTTAPALRGVARQRRQEPAFRPADSAAAEGPSAAESAGPRHHSGSDVAAGPLDRTEAATLEAPSGAELSLDWPATDSAVLREPDETHKPWISADFGVPDLDAPCRSEAIERLDQMARDGYHGACIALLEHALQSRPGKNPRLLLRLLEHYRHLQQAANHDRVAAQLESLFNLQVPLLSQRSAVFDPGWESERQPGLAEVSAVWAWPEQAQSCLRSWLLSGAHPRLSLQAFEDALCLFDLTREKLQAATPDSPVETDTADSDPVGLDTVRSTAPIDWVAWPGASAA